MQEKIEKLYKKDKFDKYDFFLFNEFISLLNTGKIRAAEKQNDKWVVNEWVKKGILAGFKMGGIKEFANGFVDKETFPPRKFTLKEGIRLVPGGSSVRVGSFIGRGVIIMPPAYINTGAFVDDYTLIDSHALVGSCAQVGKRVHLSAASQLGGVLEPINAKPVIIEDDVFIGGNSGIYEGVIIKKRAIIAAGVIITSGTPIYDAVNKKFLDKIDNSTVIPENAVVVPGSRVLKSNTDFHIYCPIIIKYRDEKSDKSVKLEDYLR